LTIRLNLSYNVIVSMKAARLLSTYGGQPMEISTVIELLKLLRMLGKLIGLVVKAIKKRKKKPP